MPINEALAYQLILNQFPHWQHLPIQAVKNSGWDNRTFHLGTEMLIRIPSGPEYAAAVEKEQIWLPKLAPMLSLHILVAGIADSNLANTKLWMRIIDEVMNDHGL